MTPFTTQSTHPTAVSPRRRPRIAFVDPLEPPPALGFVSSTPRQLETPPLSISEMVIPSEVVLRAASSHESSTWTYSVSPRSISFDQVLNRPNLDEDDQQEQGMLSFNLKDKMGLFLSVCSVLVAIQTFTPKAL